MWTGRAFNLTPTLGQHRVEVEVLVADPGI